MNFYLAFIVGVLFIIVSNQEEAMGNKGFSLVALIISIIWFFVAIFVETS